MRHMEVKLKLVPKNQDFFRSLGLDFQQDCINNKYLNFLNVMYTRKQDLNV